MQFFSYTIAPRALSFGMKLHVVEIERGNETQMRDLKVILCYQ